MARQDEIFQQMHDNASTDDIEKSAANSPE